MVLVELLLLVIGLVAIPVALVSGAMLLHFHYILLPEDPKLMLYKKVNRLSLLIGVVSIGLSYLVGWIW